MQSKNKVAIGMAMTLIAGFEGYGLHTDVGGILTDCYGNTKNVSASVTRSKAECEALLSREVGSLHDQIDKLVTVELNDNQMVALVSFTYNVGIGNFKSSTLLTLLNKGMYVEACGQLLRWVYVKKVFYQGLLNRRLVEQKYCLGAV